MAEANSTQFCVHCGAQIELTVTASGAVSRRIRRYCSKGCQYAHHDAKRPGRDRRGAREVHCHGCGVSVVRRAQSDEAGRYCSRTCNTDSMARVATERASLRRIAAAWAWRPSPLVVAEIGALRRIARYVERPKIRSVTCRRCERPLVWVVKQGGSQRICDTCQSEARKAARRAWRETAKGKSAKRAAKARRRAVERGVEADRIDPIKVFDRDKWRCHLCGCKTPQNLRGTYDPRAPEMDHVVALADGGSHTWGNVACACRECNANKGGSSRGQLGLGIAS